MENYFDVKFEVAKAMEQPLSEIENLPFYEMELAIEWLEKKNKDDKKRQDEEQGKHSMENLKQQMPKMPTYPTKFPKLR